MMLHEVALALLLQPLQFVLVASRREIDGVASPGNFIIKGEDFDLNSVLPSAKDALTIISPVPVTIQRFSGGEYLTGQEPMTSNMAKVLVTSNCGTGDTAVIPSYAVSSDGAITITLPDVTEDEASAMPFLEPSSYAADWDTKDEFCGYNPGGGDSFIPVDGGDPIILEPGIVLPDVAACGADADCDSSAGQFCQLGVGACQPVDSKEGYCMTPPEFCAEIYLPVCGCDGVEYSNECEAQSAGVVVSRMTACNAEPAPDFDVTIPFDEGIEGDVTIPFEGVEGDVTIPFEGVEADVTIPFEAIEGIVSPENNDSAATKPAVSSSATTAGSNAEEVTVSSTTATTFAAIDGNFPTGAPSKKTSMEKSKAPTLSPIEDAAAGSNSAFNRPRSLSFCVATAFVAIALLSVVFPTNGANGYIWGLGKFVVAAAAVSSIHSKKSPATKDTSSQSRGLGSKSLPAHNNERVLEDICTYNVEVLLDGCSQSAKIIAPAGRVVDVSITDRTSQQDKDDNCITNNQATLTFPVTDFTEVLTFTGADAPVVAAFDQWDWRCMQAVIGRPFVDSTGGSLQAMPLVPEIEKSESSMSALSWTSADTFVETTSSCTHNTTTHGRFLLGEDWTQRALGEHASVASFSAFSIALMTNQAPSDLVDDALRAGLDEVRHAKVSFDIASKLTGKEVGPGPLPPSKHEFGQDLTALALAVAREGCVDETLSAFVAALEVEHITSVLEKGVQDILYSSIDRFTLTSIRDELVTIATDESNHSALAWRTLNWVCDVDASACATVHRDVFGGRSLDTRLNQRADTPFGEKERVLRSMEGEWNKIFNAHRLIHSSLTDEPVSEYTCEESDNVKIGVDQDDQPLLTLVTDNILRRVSCS